MVFIKKERKFNYKTIYKNTKKNFLKEKLHCIGEKTSDSSAEDYSRVQSDKKRFVRIEY